MLINVKYNIIKISQKRVKKESNILTMNFSLVVVNATFLQDSS